MFLHYSAVDWEFLTIGDEHYLLVTNAQYQDKAMRITAVNSVPAPVLNAIQVDLLRDRSVLYRWQGVDKFVPVHHLATRPCADWETFQMNGETFIVYAGTTDNISQIFKAKLK